MKSKLILLVACISFMICSCNNDAQPSSKNTPHAESGHAAIHIAPTTVMNYEQFKQSYHPTWKGQVVTVQGIYMNLAVGNDTTGAVVGSISLYGDDDFSGRFVACSFEQSQIAQLRELVQGDTITVNGVVAGQMNNDVEISRCRLVMPDSASSKVNAREV